MRVLSVVLIIMLHSCCVLSLRKAQSVYILHMGAVTLKVNGDHVNFLIKLYSAFKSPSFGYQS